MNDQKRAWLYTRTDAPEDAHGVLKGQEKELYDYASQMGFVIAGTSSDLGGADRPGLAGMIAAARDGRFDVLLVKNIRRLGDTADSRRLFNQLYDLGIEICSPLEGKMGGTHHV